MVKKTSRGSKGETAEKKEQERVRNTRKRLRLNGERTREAGGKRNQ